MPKLQRVKDLVQVNAQGRVIANFNEENDAQSKLMSVREKLGLRPFGPLPEKKPTQHVTHRPTVDGA